MHVAYQLSNVHVNVNVWDFPVKTTMTCNLSKYTRKYQITCNLHVTSNFAVCQATWPSTLQGSLGPSCVATPGPGPPTAGADESRKYASRRSSGGWCVDWAQANVQRKGFSHYRSRNPG